MFFVTLAVPLYAAELVETVVSGVEGDLLKNVQDTLVLPSGLERDGTVDRLWLERFTTQAEQKTKSALEPFGYYNPQVTVAIEPFGERFRLLVKIQLGEPVRLSAVTVTLHGPGSEEKRLFRLATLFPLKKGDVLLHQSYEEAKAQLVQRAGDMGYLDAEFTRHEIRIDATATTAGIELALETGARYYFGATSMTGAPEYPDVFLRRHLTYGSGEIFSYPRLGETQRNFSNSERFKEVLIVPEKQNSEDFRVPVTIQLQPRPSRSLRPGVGYGTDTGARFTTRYRDLNMFNLGHELYSNLFIAERLQGLVTGYILPSPRDVRTSTTLQLNLQQEETSTYNSRILALEMDHNRSFGASRLATTYLKVQYEDYTVSSETSTSRLLLPGLRFSEDRYENPIRPRRGFRYALELRGTHQFLGSDTALVQFLAGGSYLQPLPWSLSLHTRAQAGTTVLNDHLRAIPPSLRFFAGGDQSVRGYSYKSLGPRDADGRIMGGKQLFTGSIELERALFTDWGLSLFYDVGNTFNSISAITLAQGAGVGLHYYTSVGALNLSLAWPLATDNPSIHFHFTVGFEL
jgi:translocation and assembly module TamA